MNDRQEEIILWYSDQLRSGGADEGLLERALARGFTEQEIREALEAVRTQVLGALPLVADASTTPEKARPLRVAQLSDEATRFLNTLRDLGYLDEGLEDEVLDGVMAELPADEFVLGARPNIELEDLRPHVATVLFDRQSELAPETLRLLEAEWRLVFH